MIRVAILGATGSIGTSALSVAEAHPERVQVVGPWRTSETPSPT